MEGQVAGAPHRRGGIDGGKKNPGATVEHQPMMSRVTEVAACTMAAAHRRDHDHGVGADECHPHVVEVVHWDEQRCACATTAGSTQDSSRVARLRQWPPTIAK